jgi:hypothetical protein
MPVWRGGQIWIASWLDGGRVKSPEKTEIVSQRRPGGVSGVCFHTGPKPRAEGRSQRRDLAAAATASRATVTLMMPNGSLVTQNTSGLPLASAFFRPVQGDRAGNRTGWCTPTQGSPRAVVVPIPTKRTTPTDLGRARSRRECCECWGSGA